MADETNKGIISIGKSNVLTEVRKTIEYIGVLSITDNGGNIYDLIKASKEAEEMLDRFYREGCADIGHYCKRFVTAVTFTPNDEEEGESASFSIAFNEKRYNDKLENVIKQDIFSYIVNSSVYKWLLLGNLAKDRVQMYKVIADSFLRNTRTSMSAAASEGGSEEESTGAVSIGAAAEDSSTSSEEESTGAVTWGGHDRLTLEDIL